MGYWAKDGAYVHDDDDARAMMHESDGDRWDRLNRMSERAKEEEARRKARQEREREERAENKRALMEAEFERNRKYSEELERHREAKKKSENLARYGVEYDLRHPETLSDRRSRANFWRIQNNWSVLKNAINGKSKKFSALWDKYSEAKTDEERLQLVEKMEKLFPTKERNIRKVEKNEGWHR